ncbi:hypothetical protein [Mycobacterium marinum]|uniref:hypothetical protein n=1 Tax=Mycobacterium marinum TaxID=1781 RepID=UPI000358EFBB|nr:hypothetical protein [Mycobacterium marinum]EPQ74299.1 hypothetical protein MMEU_1959 [Mycobacterium marinum str. Europe]WOR03658.1 hypothetical protein QDR78_21225 [Mycobacterium marinum]
MMTPAFLMRLERTGHTALAGSAVVHVAARAAGAGTGLPHQHMAALRGTAIHFRSRQQMAGQNSYR